MKRNVFPRLLAVLWIVICLSLASSQTQPKVDGHWEGDIDIRTKKLEIHVDLAQKKDVGWVANIDIPARGVRDYPLTDIVVQGDKISFAMRDIRGAPHFNGILTEGGNVISGDFIQANTRFPFKLDRRGKADFEQEWKKKYGQTPDKGVPGEGLIGIWQGTLDSTYLLRELNPAADLEAGASVRIILKVTSPKSGTYAGSIDCPDQNVSDISVAIVLHDKSVEFGQEETQSGYKGRLNPDNSEIDGDWTSGDWTLPLIFKRLKN